METRVNARHIVISDETIMVLLVMTAVPVSFVNSPGNTGLMKPPGAAITPNPLILLSIFKISAAIWTLVWVNF